MLGCVALAGYNMTLIDDPKKEVMLSVKSSPEMRSDSPQTRIGQTYSQNASNLIQNNLSLIQTAAVAEKTLDVKSGGQETAKEESDQTEIVECEKGISNRKYKISSAPPANAVVKKIFDKLLTPYITDKFVVENESEVLKILTSNTRNPYLIWDNGTRAQLLEFLDTQRTQSVREQFEDVTDIYNMVKDFSFDAHR
jgi:DnaJ family protein C protein 13